MFALKKYSRRSLHTKAFAIVKKAVYNDVVLSNAYCPYELDAITTYRIGKAECGQRAILLVDVLRALGMPSSIDFTPVWADYSNKSHACVSVIGKNVFVNKNSGIVTLEFNRAWKKLKEAGLTEQLDSAKDANDAINYMFNRQMIKDLYRSYGTPQKKYLAELDKNKPKMMSMLEGLEKKARMKEEEKTKTVSKEFVW